MIGTSYKMMYSDSIDNHAIVGPLLKSIITNNDQDCKDACFMHVPDVCYMFNYYPQTKKCELFYKDRVSDYKVEERNGCYFKTREVGIWHFARSTTVCQVYTYEIEEKLSNNKDSKT